MGEHCGGNHRNISMYRVSKQVILSNSCSHNISSLSTANCTNLLLSLSHMCVEIDRDSYIFPIYGLLISVNVKEST